MNAVLSCLKKPFELALPIKDPHLTNPLSLAGSGREGCDELVLGHARTSSDPKAGRKVDQLRLAVGTKAICRVPIECARGLLCGADQLIPQLLGCLDLFVRFIRLAVGLGRQFLRLTLGFLGRCTCGPRRLVREARCFRELVGSIGDELLGVLAGLFGLAVRVRQLVLDLFRDLTPMLLSLRLRSAPFALHEFPRGYFSLGNALFDVLSRPALLLLQTTASTLTDFFSSLGASLSVLCSLSRSVLSFPRALRGIPCSPNPDVYRVTAQRSRIDHGRSDFSPLIAHARRRRLSGFLDRIHGTQSSRQ